MVREEYITDELVVKRAKAAVAIELEKKRALDLPAVVYDPTTESIYHVYSDGTRVEIGTFRIFKKRKEKCFYEECNDWRLEDIQLITGINYMEQKELN